MTHSTLTNQIRLTPKQFSSRNGATIDTFLIHHQAGTNDDATINAMVTGSKQVSANYTISNEGRITLVVDEDNRAWTSSSAHWDGRSITVEIENEFGDPSWGISNAALNAAAALLNDLRNRYKIVRVIGHRDLHTAEYGFASYPTYCPGPNTVAEIVRRADAGTTPAPTPNTNQGDIMARYLWAPDRGGILITETDGVFFPAMAGKDEPLAWDFRKVQAKLFNGIDVTTREWDIARQDALDRQAALGKSADALTAAINAAIDNALDGVVIDSDVQIDVGAIAKAVREEFKTNPLS